MPDLDFASDYAARSDAADTIAMLTRERDRLRKRLDGVERDLATALQEQVSHAISPARLAGV